MALGVCPGEIATDVDGALLCLDDMGAPLAWEEVPTFSVTEIDPATATAAYAGGFVIVGMAWAIGWSFRAVLSMIRR